MPPGRSSSPWSASCSAPGRFRRPPRRRGRGRRPCPRCSGPNCSPSTPRALDGAAPLQAAGDKGSGTRDSEGTDLFRGHESLTGGKPMPERPRLFWVRPWGKVAALTGLAALLVVLGRAVLPWDAMFPDFICYWTAGKLLASGQSPYDADLQTRTQREYGWDKETTGRGTYDFLPFYYPPWFGLLWVPAVPLGFQAAKVAWFFLNVE